MKRLIFLALVALLCLNACVRQEPIRLGFIGGLSDRSSDLGQAALEAVEMAVEQFNRAGGVDGRLVELVVRDDAQNPLVAAQSAKELVAAQVEAVIGPFTSAMGEVIVPILGQAGIFEVSPTMTSMAFYGKDDNLFRINRTTRDNARDYAHVIVARGYQRIAVAYDLRNRNFTESWLHEFREAVSREGGQVVRAVDYSSSELTDFAGTISQMREAGPDFLFFISAAVDVARLAQEARVQVPALPIGAAEWAATEQLTRYGGRVIEGLLIVQSFNREDLSPRFQVFADAYQQRYQRFPGYTAVMAHDAATVVLTALQKRRAGESLKAAALRAGPYDGLQEQIVFDANGDTQRKIVFTQVQGGRFVQVLP